MAPSPLQRMVSPNVLQLKESQVRGMFGAHYIYLLTNSVALRVFVCVFKVLKAQVFCFLVFFPNFK